MTVVRTVLALAVLSVAPRAMAESVRRALVVAYNGSDAPETPPLRYADDDGLRWLEVFQRLGIETTLLTVPDPETASSDATLLRGVNEPSRAALSRAVEAMAAKNRADRAAGRTVDTFVVYVGHGQTDAAGRAYLTLLDGRLDQAALYGEVVDRLDADFVHLVVDACHASGVVGSRGGDAKVVDQLRRTLQAQLLVQRPRVGVIYAESEDGTTHEWSRLRAGVFSHVLRSGILGGADVNGDGQLSYGELEAFVAASIRGVRSPQARLSVKASAPPLQPERPFVGPPPPGPQLRLPAGEAWARVSVEDDSGVRLLDANRGGAVVMTYALPARANYVVRVNGGEFRVAERDLGAPLPVPAPSEVAQRGEAESLLRGLYAVPYDRSFYQGYLASSDQVPVEFVAKPAPPPPPRGPFAGGSWAVGLTLQGPLLGGTGVTGGFAAAWRSSPTWYWGARVAYAFNPDALSGSGTVQNFSLTALGGWTAETRWAPFVELGFGWLPTLVTRPGVTQGDPAGFTARASAGVQVKAQPVGIRIAASVDMDAVSVDGQRQVNWIPGLELAATF